MIVPQYAFNCGGRVTRFAASLKYSDSKGNLPIVQIWRPSSHHSTVYNKVFEEQIANFTQKGSLHVADIKISDSNLIEFQPGDVIGYYQPSNLQFAIRNYQTDGYISYVTSDAYNSITKINVNDSTAINQRQPLIEVLFGKESCLLSCSLCYLHIKKTKYLLHVCVLLE